MIKKFKLLPESVCIKFIS